MNRKQMVAGNWKMHTTVGEGINLALAVAQGLKGKKVNASVVVAPPFTHLAEVARVLKESGIAVAAQNCASEPKGAFTGEVSAAMIRSCGASYVIIGHSERRTYFREEDVVLHKKLQLTLENELVPIFCCGELLEERNAGKHFSVVKKQMEQALFPFSIDNFRKIVIAYEPVWAIGTGVNATPAQAQEMHHYIRHLITDKYGLEAAGQTSILYGGSCKPSNAGELFANEDVDGGLIGGASLIAADFIDIVMAVK
jgi:triosephosphate isomerase